MNRPNQPSEKQRLEQEPQSPLFEMGQLRRFNELLLRFLPIGIVIIDRSYRVLTVNGAARRLLGLRDIAIEQDFLHAVRGVPYHETRSAIDTVFRKHMLITLPEVELEAASGGNGRFVSLSISPMHQEANMPDLLAISVTDVDEQVQARRQLETVQAEQTHLMQELGTANKRLNDMNKELMDANEELQVANEELVLTHEELQASIEEFETTNEELQATNEELETTNEELRARTGELQEMTSILENERVRLSEMVELAPFSILVLRGPSLVVEAYNPRYANLLEGREVLGRPLEEVIDLLWEPDTEYSLLQTAREVYIQETSKTTPRIRAFTPGAPNLRDEQQESYFSYTLVPSHTTLGHVNGVIIYATDETEQHAKEMEEEVEHLRAIFDNTQTIALALYDAQSQRLIVASPRYLELVSLFHNLTPDDAIGRTWQEVTLLPSTGEDAVERWNTALQSRTSLRIPEAAFAFPQQQTETIWDYELTPIVDGTQLENVRYILVTSVEITEQVQARQNLEHLERLRDNFLSMATHELRTPLTSIQANVQLLQHALQRYVSTHDAEKAQTQQLSQGIKQIDTVVHQINQMNRQISEMLDVTRLRTDVFELHLQENVDLVALVRRVVEQQSALGHSISTHASQEPLPVTLDESRIEQVLNNLLSNAIKYSPTNTPIEVSIERQRGGAMVSIQDYGDGIEENDQLHIFDRFYRVATKQAAPIEGLGLGLYIASEIVKRHGGRLEVRSTPGQGSTFFFTLPLSKS